MLFDAQKMNKLPVEDRFFDINDLWYFWNARAVKFLFSTRVTANQVTAWSLAMGGISALCFLWGGATANIVAGIFLYLKVFLDNVDGNLARVREEESRLGRFFDSLTDFSVTLMVYLAAICRIIMDTGEIGWIFLAIAALASSYMQCSYFVYYLVKYSELCGTYTKNRADEAITQQDIDAAEWDETSRFALKLQKIHAFIYGWQDKSIALLDSHLRSRSVVSGGIWYQDKSFMSWISPLCVCTNNMLLVAFAFADRVDIFFGFVVVIGNAYWILLIAWKSLKPA